MTSATAPAPGSRIRAAGTWHMPRISWVKVSAIELLDDDDGGVMGDGRAQAVNRLDLATVRGPEGQPRHGGPQAQRAAVPDPQA